MDMYDLLNWMNSGKTPEFYYLLKNYVERELQNNTSKEGKN